MSCDWIGSILLAICGLPQAIKSYKEGHAYDVSWIFLLLWLGGEIALLIDRFPKHDWALVLNYIANIAFISIILKYKIKPRRLNER